MKAIDILELAMYAGRIMLESGAEVYRVEDTVARICKSFGASRIECTITVTGMDASICYQGETVTLIQRVRKKEINLTKIERINQLSRDLAQGEPDIQKAKNCWMKLTPFEAIKPYGWSCFPVFLPLFLFHVQRKNRKQHIGFFTGALTRLVLILLAKAGFTGFINDLAGGMLISFFSISLSSFFNTGNINEIIIGSIMILVPGVAITNAILDIFHQDYISGTVKAVDALLTIVAVSAGVAIVFSLSNMFEGGFL